MNRYRVTVIANSKHFDDSFKSTAIHKTFSLVGSGPL